MKRLLGTLCLLAAGAAHSATVTQCGPNVCYQYDDAQIAGSTAYFGQPTLIGDDLRFLPTTFRAESIDGVGTTSGTNTDVYGTTFVFDRIYSVSGAEIQSISITERGDFGITNDGNVRAELYMLVANNNDALECDCDINVFQASGANSLQSWQLSAGINPASAFTSPANDVSLSLQNTLFAYSDAAGETAFIQKKFATVSVNVVPIPAAVWLFGSGLALLGWIRRRSGCTN